MTPLITLSGPDGSGKTTQLEMLKAQLKSSGHKPVIFWSRLGYTPGFEAAKKIARRIMRTKLAQRGEGHKRDAAMQKSSVRGTWRLVATADLLITYALIVRALRLAGYTVIADRYVWDALVDRQMYHADADWMERVIRRGFALLGAKPDLALLFDLPLAVSQARSEAKDEPFPDPPELRARRHRLYRELRNDPRLRVLDVDRPPQQIADEIAAEILALLKK